VPHITVEYSANMQTRTDIPGLIRVVHEAALTTGLFATAAVRTRAVRRDVYAVADEHPQNAFIALSLRIANGRSDADKERLADTVFDAVCRSIDRDGAQERLALSLEILEIIETGARRRNALHGMPMDPVTPGPLPAEKA
jgi:5-carboxymethyl-2-hydroxymuconate isomerase